MVYFVKEKKDVTVSRGRRRRRKKKEKKKTSKSKIESVFNFNTIFFFILYVLSINGQWLFSFIFSFLSTVVEEL